MKEAIEKWLNEINVDLVKNYNTLGLKASGNWERQLESKVVESSKGFNAIILGAKYTGAMQYGRKATSEAKKGRLYNIILKWIDDKGLSIPENRKKSFAYLVARKIDREGIKVPNKFNKGTLLTDVITDQKISSLGKRLLLVYVDNVKSDVIRQWQSPK